MATSKRLKKNRYTKIGFRSTFHRKVVQTAVFDHCTELLGQFFQHNERILLSQILGDF